jgi:1,2-diacylglycerol 3-beta-galactosyltransferase
LLCVSLVEARRLSPSPTVPSKKESGENKKVLMLISDTGGGHRASALALEAAMLQEKPKGMEVKVVDIWTEHAMFPWNKMAAGYPFCCKYPFIWKSMYYTTMALELPTQLLWRIQCGAGFKRCIGAYDPDMVVSLHPLCQHLPLNVMNTLAKENGQNRRSVPFATVCTDLGGAHPSWFHKGVDMCFIASEAVRKVANRRGVDGEKLKLYGLPVRKAFWTASEQNAHATPEQLESLGLQPDKKTVLVVGGGDGVGSLQTIVESTAAQLAKDCPDTAQVVAICGKNAAVKRQLEAKSWRGVHVEVRGFCSGISDYMQAADCLVTKAGPGTIAEAAIRGLPTMLSSHLPGQEAGNVPFVVGKGFGRFSTKPKVIAQTVSEWLQDDDELAQLSAAALAAGQPEATNLIARDLVELLDKNAA